MYGCSACSGFGSIFGSIFASAAGSVFVSVAALGAVSGDERVNPVHDGRMTEIPSILPLEGSGGSRKEEGCGDFVGPPGAGRCV